MPLKVDCLSKTQAGRDRESDQKSELKFEISFSFVFWAWGFEE